MESETKWELSWKRPENIPYPKVWHTFENISKKNGRKYKINIQDIPPERFEEAIKFNETNVDPYEPILRALQIWKDPESVIAFRTVRWKVLEQRISLMAVIDKEEDVHSKPEIVGTLLLAVKLKNDPPTKQAGKQLNKLFDLFAHGTKGFDQFQLLESDRYILHLGLAVSPKYRGLGVGLELELQSATVGKACGIRGASVSFTSMYSQPFWKKMGCTFLNEVRYDEFKNENGEVIIPNVEDASAVMFFIWKYPQVVQ